MADNMVVDTTQVEQKIITEVHQDEQLNLQENADTQMYKDQQDHLNRQINGTVGINGNVRVNLPKTKQEKLQITSSAQIPKQAEPEPSYISFNEALFQGKEEDRRLMMVLREKLKNYAELKKSYDKRTTEMERHNERALLEQCLMSLESIENICVQYSEISLPFLFGKKEAKKKKDEMAALSSKIRDEMAKLSDDYYTIIADEFTATAKYDVNLKNRNRLASGTMTREKEIRVGEDNKLDFGAWGKALDFADYEMKSVKNYLRLRCHVEGTKKVNNKDFYNSKEKDLLNKINEYAQINDITRQLSGTDKKKTKERNMYMKIQKKEYELYKEITAELETRVKEPKLSEDKRSVFLTFLNLLMRDTEGTLPYPQDQAIEDYTDMKDYKISHFVDKKDGTRKIIQLKNKKADFKKYPLFAHVPCVSDVSQNTVGNCYLLASIAEVVANDPKAITNMFRDEGENVVVRLYHHDMVPDPSHPGDYKENGMKPVYLRINKEVDMGVSQGALWVNLLCKAYTLYVQNYNSTSHYQSINKDINELKEPKNMKDLKTIDYGFIDVGGTARDALPILTGKMSAELTSINGTVFKATTPTGVIAEEYNKKHGKVVIAEESNQQNQKAVIKVGNVVGLKSIWDQETAVFEYNNYTYIYHKDIHEGLIPENPTWDDKTQLSYLQAFSLGSERFLNLTCSKMGANLHEVLRDPEAIEEELRRAEPDNVIKKFIWDCIYTLQAAGAKVGKDTTEMAEFGQEIYWNMKIEAIRMLKDSCKSAKRMTKDEEEKAEYFTGNYTQEALDVFDKIVDARSKGLTVSAGTRENLGKEKSSSGNETMGVGVAGSHAYSVLDAVKMEYNGKVIRMVRVRNPWGQYTTSYRRNSETGKVEAVTERRADNGEFLMELTHFVQMFANFSITSEN